MSPLSSRALTIPPGGEGTVTCPPCYYQGVTVSAGGAVTSVENLGRQLVLGAGPGGGSLLPRNVGEVINGELVVTGDPGSVVTLYFDF